MNDRYDVAIVGAGVVGLAHALAATRLGLRTVVVDRDAQANGASIRNFGFVTVTGQERGAPWRRARRSREVWAEIAPQAGIAFTQRGLALVVRRREARAVAEAFLETEMAEGCRWLDGAAARDVLGPARPSRLEGALHSDVELRVEPRTAMPALAAWLEQARGVEFRRGVAARGVDTGRLDTTAGTIRAQAVIVCSGDDLSTLFPDALAQAGVTRCRLQMLRLAPPDGRLPATLMSDLGMARYLGYARLPQAEALRARLLAEQPDHLAHGVHLIVAQSADGTLVVGDSHHYGHTPDPFAPAEVERLILDEFGHVFGAAPPVVERWTGTYASASSHSLVAEPAPGVRLVVVTSGSGMSTAFGLAEEVIGGIAHIRMGAAA